MGHGSLPTVFGWNIHVGPDANPRSLQNFPMQANGAEMLRLACIFATESGVEVCGPIHDAVLIHAPLARLEDDIRTTQEAMAKASRIVLKGFELGTEVKPVIYPDRYMDVKRGKAMWDCVWAQIEMVEADKSGDLKRRNAAIARRIAALDALRSHITKVAA